MKTKSALNTAISGFISVVVRITKVISSFSAVVDELFPTLVDVVSSATTYANPASAGSFPYALVFCKQGGRSYVYGWFKNLAATLNNTEIATITDNSLLVSDHVIPGGDPILYTCKAKNSVTGQVITISISSISGATKIKVLGAWDSDFNGKYVIQDSLQYNNLN